jgi:RNA polymerase sigma-70 factor (ECF subfamily)
VLALTRRSPFSTPGPRPLDAPGSDAAAGAGAQEVGAAAGRFEQLVREWWPQIQPLVERLVEDAALAEDLTQECFLRLERRLARVQDGPQLGGYLRSIALNLVRDHFRSRGRRAPMHSLESVERPDERSADPAEDLAARELEAALQREIALLPPKLQLAFTSRVIEGLEYDHIAQLTGVKPATLRVQVMQARQRLERRLAPLLEDPS